MTARNPTTFTNFIEERNMLEGDKILQTDPDATFNDQVMCLDSEQQVVSDSFLPKRVTSTSYIEIKRYHVRGKDTCTNSTTNTSHQVTARIFIDNGHTVTVRVDTTVAGSSTFATFTNSTGVGIETDLNVGTLKLRDNTEETITVNMKAASGSDPEIFGILIYGIQS